MNTYSKYAPNVWLAKCTEKHEKNSVIPVANKYGQENESIVFNLIFQKDGFFYYSIIRADGFNVQEWAKRRAEKLQNAAIRSEQKSESYYNASNKHSDFLSLGEPIKVGHHSENRHRRIIEQANNNMSKCVELSDKAKDQESRATYWESKAQTINLSMPESIEYYKYKLEQAKAKHEGYKNGSIKQEHSYSLVYATKELKDCQDKLKTSYKLWGDIEVNKENAPKTKSIKEYTEQKQTELFDKTGAFFAFSTEQFNEAKKEGVKYASLGAGLICPSENVETFIKEFKAISKEAIKQDLEDNGRETIIKRELYNYECFYICDIAEAVKALKKYGISEQEVKEVYNVEKENIDY